jgi:hypothetical protein
VWLDYTRPQPHREQFWRHRPELKGITTVQYKRRTLTVAPARRPSKKDRGVLKSTDLAKQLSELRQLRQQVQAAEAASTSTRA